MHADRGYLSSMKAGCRNIALQPVRDIRRSQELREESYLDFGGKSHDNVCMRNHGIVHNGMIVIDGGVPLPEGTRVVVSIEAESAESEPSEYRVQFPLVYSETPGQLHLTNEEIAEYLDDDEISR